ncbi:MAG: GNAT family N-acetyltransferase [Verrucomicrobiae bacterium]|nr:GNAT family N-acetyltransferase [Verrucomicrobiae bacterium]
MNQLKGLFFSNLTDLDIPLFSDLTYPIYQSRFRIFRLGPSSPVVAVGVRDGENPIGLGLAELDVQTGLGLLLSIYVTPNFRRRGVATALLQQVESESSRRGCRSLCATFERDQRHVAYERLLRRCHYPVPVPRSLVGHAHGVRLLEAPWMRHSILPKAFQIFPWKNLSSAEEDVIRSHEGRPQWHPPFLSPFNTGWAIEPLNSLGLRNRGEVVGWQINHRITSDTIRYTATFVREDLQSHGLAIPLLANSIRLHIETSIDTFPKATFVIPLAMKRMVLFVRHHMQPFLDELNDSVESWKKLEQG